MPARAGALIKVFAQFDVEVVKGKRGSHWKLRRKGRRPYIIPCGNGVRTELSDNYIQSACRNLGIEERQVWDALGQTGKKKKVK